MAPMLSVSHSSRRAPPGNDLRLDIQKVEDARNFANKLWNATRFALRPIGEAEIVMGEDGPARSSGELALADRWILSRLDATIDDATRLMQVHQYGEAGKTMLRELVWSELCRLVYRGGQGPPT